MVACAELRDSAVRSGSVWPVGVVGSLFESVAFSESLWKLVGLGMSCKIVETWKSASV